MNPYEEKQEAKRQRLQNAAENAENNAAKAYKQSDLSESASGIPFGQPILVGHHSEKRHRAAIKRSHNAMDRAVLHTKRAGEFRDRIASVGTGGISVDDPDALIKLQTKLSDLENKQKFMKSANMIIRKLVKQGVTSASNTVDLNPIIEFAATRVPYDKAETLARNLMEPDYSNRIGFATYELTNNNAKIVATNNRIRRIEILDKAETKTEEIGDLCKYVENADEKRVQFIFDGKPSDKIRAILKQNAFRWAPSNNAWQRQLNNNGRYSAKLVIAKLRELDA